ncbi:hypothetical protein ABBQ32_000807 [Trebouxia sp. C0010 RCD-2024]
MAVNKMWRHAGDEHLTSFWELLLDSLASPAREVAEICNIVSVYSGHPHQYIDTSTDSSAELNDSNSNTGKIWFQPPVLQFGKGPLQGIAFISSQLGFLDTGADQPFPVNLHNAYRLYHDLAFSQHLSQLLNANQPADLITDHDQHGNRMPQFVPFLVQYTDAHQPFDAQRLARLMGADAVIQQELVTRNYQADRTDAAFLHWLSTDPTQAHTWNMFKHAAQHLNDYTQGAFEVRLTVENDARRSLVQPAMIMWVGVSSNGNALGMMTEELHCVLGWRSGSNSDEFSLGSGPTGVTTQGSANSDRQDND